LKNCRIKKVAELKRWDNYIDEPEEKN
jgi:hypothetical protein